MANRLVISNIGLLATPLGRTAAVGPAQGQISQRAGAYLVACLLYTSGGFFCGQDADSEGEEGKYYAFTPEEIRTVLGEADVTP